MFGQQTNEVNFNCLAIKLLLNMDGRGNYNKQKKEAFILFQHIKYDEKR
ncbi:hypothetical protein MY9_1913 [Bacillus sp. JS]|nr:hypothetical protein MY9_1913 [Bacillus sp. JS]